MPLKLYPEQLQIIAPYFDGATETVIIQPKKAGKSTLVAALSLYHLLVTPDAECIVVAASREQAEIILRQARHMIRRSSALSALMKVMRREINSLEDGGRVRVLASDEDTADGVLPTLAIVDELHRHKTGDLYGVLRLGLGARGGRMITISTAGATLASPLGELRRKAYEIPGFVRDAKKRRSYVRSANGKFAFLEWCLNPDDDPSNMRLVKLVNPAPWRTIPVLAEEHASPSMTPWQWLRFACGVWTEGEEPWISPQSWDDLADPSLEIPDGSGVVMGIDVALRRDTTAIALVMPDGQDYRVKVHIYGTPESQMPLQDVEDEVRKLASRYYVWNMVYTAKAFERSADMLIAEGYPVYQLPQSPERMIAITQTLYKLIEEKRLHHDGDPELRAQVMAGHIKETERGGRFTKDIRAPRPIDALMALAAACHIAVDGAVNSEPGLIVL